MKKISSENVKKVISEITKVLPVAWVVNCYDSGGNWMWDHPFQGLWGLFSAIVFCYVLLKIGLLVASENKGIGIARLLCLVLFLVVCTTVLKY